MLPKWLALVVLMLLAEGIWLAVAHFQSTVLLENVAAAQPPPRQPAEKPAGLARKTETRTIAGYGGAIRVTTRPNGEIELLDENDRARYATDSLWGDKRLTKQDSGDLSYVTERGDAVTIHANNDRTTSIPKLKLTLRQRIGSDGKATTGEFTFGQGVVIEGRGMAGRWMSRGSPPNSLELVDDEGKPLLKNGSPILFRGKLELTNFYEGEYCLTDAAARLRSTQRRDGYQRVERLDAQNQAVRSARESFPDGRRIERTILDAERVIQLGIQGKQAEAVLLVFANGERYRLTEISDSTGRYVARIEFPKGDTFARRGRSAVWDRTDKPPPQPDPHYLDVERLGQDTLRLAHPRLHRIDTLMGDGSWTRELLTEETRLTDALTLERMERPEYTIRHWPGGRASLTDGSSRRTYATDTERESERLFRDEKTGALTFIDAFSNKITIRSDGSRSIVNDRGAGGRLETDEGGRMIAQYDRSQQLVAEYHYQKQDERGWILDQFQLKKEGWSLWKMTPLPGGKQSWRLSSGAGGKVARDAERIEMDRHNSMVFEKADERTIKKIDGAVITKSQAREAGNLVTRIKVSVQKGSGVEEAYALTTKKDAAGRIMEQELSSKAGRFVRGEMGQEFLKSGWREFDAAGKSIGTGWFGDVAIDDQGTLIKRSFVMHPRGSNPTAPLKFTKDAQGRERPAFDNTVAIYTNAESCRWFADGAGILKDKQGNAKWIHFPSGREICFSFGPGEKPDSRRRIEAMYYQGRLWWYNREHGRFDSGRVDARGNRLKSKSSATHVSIEYRDQNAEVRLINVASRAKAQTKLSLDGTISRVSEGSKARVDTNAAGRLTRYLNEHGTGIVFHWDEAGRLVRMDEVGGATIVHADYVAPPDQPLPEKDVIKGTELEIHGWGEEKFLSYVNLQRRRTQRWLDHAWEEYATAENATVVRSKVPGGPLIVKQGHLEGGEKALPGVLEVAQEIRPWSGARHDKCVDYVSKEGARIVHFLDGSQREYDSHDRLVRTLNVAGKSTVLTYAQENDRAPASVKADAWELRRDAASGQALLKMPAGGGQAASERRIDNFSLDTEGNLVICHGESEGSRPGLEVHFNRSGQRVEVSHDGAVTQFDAKNRIDRVRDDWAGSSILTYRGDDRVPVTIVTFAPPRESPESARRQDGTWTRTTETPGGPAAVCRWKNEGTGESVERAAFTPEGRFAFRARASEIPLSLQEPRGTLELHHDGGRLKGFTRTAKRSDGTVIVTRVSRSGDRWTDGQGQVYESLWAIAQPVQVCLVAEFGRTLVVIDSAGREGRTRYDDRFNLLSHVELDAVCEPTLMVDATLSTTRLLREANRAVEGIMQGENLISRKRGTPNQWMMSRNPNARIVASMTINTQGDQYWSGENGVERIVRANGTVEVGQPDKSWAIYPPDREFIRYVHAPGNEVQHVTAYEDGRVSVTFDSGLMQRQDAYSDVIEFFDEVGQPMRSTDGAPKVSRGFLDVTEMGSLTRYGADSQNVTTYYANGRSVRFDSQTGGWAEPTSGQVLPDAESWHGRLRSSGAAIPVRSGNDYRMEKAVLVLSSLQFQLEQLAPEAGQPPPTMPDRLQLAYEWMMGYTGPNNVAEGLRRIREAAERGDRIAQRCLGEAYAGGHGVKADGEQAMRWMSAAAEAADAEAQYLLGNWLKAGKFSAPNPGRARDMYARAAAAGHPAAQLAKVPLSAFQKLPGHLRQIAPYAVFENAESGDPRAIFYVGVELLIRKEFALAKEWLTKAADKDYEPAKLKLVEVEKKLAEQKASEDKPR